LFQRRDNQVTTGTGGLTANVQQQMTITNVYLLLNAQAKMMQENADGGTGTTSAVCTRQYISIYYNAGAT